jgi:phosphoglycerol transferase MdoB-like AlkP superfamily enzyme
MILFRNFKAIKPYLALFLLVQTIIRVSLLAREAIDLEFTSLEVFKIFAVGLYFDVLVSVFFTLPLLMVLTLLPNRFFTSKTFTIAKIILPILFIFTLNFGFVAEHIFWDEFTTRFNFIAVDYLVYTTEVIGNIKESYPLYIIFPAIFLVSIAVYYFTRKFFNKIDVSFVSAKQRTATFFACVILMLASYFGGDYNQSQISKENQVANELAGNGVYNLFYAFWNNEIDYERFYKKQDSQQVIKHTKELLTEKEKGVTITQVDFNTKKIDYDAPSKFKNVIIVVMESMSADYMGRYTEGSTLTPSLDRFAKEGYSFDKNYATGTRTVRGLEAVSLSIPPTPGQSILRRKNNENLFSAGFIFKDRGYDTKFIYGGNGFFDNMNYFFENNGFDIVDRKSFSKEETEFGNVWGLCDEDLFKKVISEADKSYANNKKFMHMVMTTSNHRPYTYPEGKIDIPSKNGRSGGVKYADYSVGKLVEWAQTKPWFKDTVFVFVADHTAGAGGKAELDLKKYHIPMIFYSPNFIKPASYNKTSSQIDLMPTLLGLLKFDYISKFYGEDLINDTDEVPHAFISNYQKVALIKRDKLVVLKPKAELQQLSWPEQVNENDMDKELIDDTIAYYQSASWWKTNYKRIDTICKDCKK